MTADPRSDGAARTAVFVVEGDARVRRGVRSVIESFPELEVAGEASSVATALRLLAQVPADIVVVDLALPTVEEGLNLVRDLSRNGCSVVVTSIHSTLAEPASRVGAFSFVEKDQRGAVGLIDAIRTAANHVN